MINSKRTLKPILVLLGGGRGNWPNWWSVLAYPPSKVYYIPCIGDNENLETMEWLLSSPAESGRSEPVPHQILPAVNAFAPEDTNLACTDIIGKHAGETILINMTQAPKIMSFGAIAAARESHRPNVLVFHRDTVRGVTHFIVGEPLKPAQFKLTVSQYVAAYGRNTESGFDWDALLPCKPLTLRKAAWEIGQRGLAAFTLLNQVRAVERQTTDQGQKICRVGTPEAWDPDWEPLLQCLKDFGLIQHLSFSQHRDSATIVFPTQHAYNFVQGNWLELYVAAEAGCLTEPDGSDSFAQSRNSVMIPVHDQDTALGDINTNELDFMGIIQQGTLLYASCKSGRNPFIEVNLDEVVARANLLGHEYCGKMFVTLAPRAAASVAFIQKASRQHITLAGAEDLPDLQQKILEALDETRRHAR